MKKVILVMLIIAVVVWVFNAVANADAFCDLQDYVSENEEITELYSGTLDETNNIYKVAGLIDTKWLDKNYADGDLNWETKDDWFVSWYQDMLMEYYPEYGNVVVEMVKFDMQNETQIYKITVWAENDLVDWIDGDQTTVEMLVAFQ